MPASRFGVLDFWAPLFSGPIAWLAAQRPAPAAGPSLSTGLDYKAAEGLAFLTPLRGIPAARTDPLVLLLTLVLPDSMAAPRGFDRLAPM